jgi:hypothetical protein
MGEVETLLLYCNKTKPFLRDKHNAYGDYHCFPEHVIAANYLNGKIAALCEFEIEKTETFLGCNYKTKSLGGFALQSRSCLNGVELDNYLQGKTGCAIHIKNLHVFDSPLELNEFLYEDVTDGHYGIWPVERVPKNGTVICTGWKDIGGVYCCRGTYGRFLALSPEEMCRVLKGEQTVVIRKTFIKGAEDNEG